MTKCKYIDGYIAQIESGEKPASKELKQACELVKRKLSADGVSVDVTKIEKAKELIERYFDVSLFDWELFVIALVHCYDADGVPLFGELLIVMGRGNGKSGFISQLIWYLTTKYHGINGYNVDIVANSEEQAKTSYDDVYEMLERTWGKSKKFFYKTREIIKNLNTQSYIKYNTTGAKTKDGKRSACLVFDEIHEYENDSLISVFRSGFGKRPHSRIFYITTNGYVRDGVLDDKLRIAKDVLNGELEQSRMLPLIYKLDAKEEAENQDMWVKANPSLPYLPNLKKEIEQNWIDKDYDEGVKRDLYTKRFNLPTSESDLSVTDYDNIKATNRPIPDLTGWSCVCGIDYAELSDWTGVVLHFKKGEQRYDIAHGWLCRNSKTLFRVKAPWQEWADKGLLTVVDDVGIHPDLIAGWIWEQMKRYNIQLLAMDGFRFALIAESLKKIGFDAERKNIKLIRPSDIMRIEPIIQECFNRQYLTWGDNPVMRWCANNTKRVKSGAKLRTGVDTGNYVYSKIEGKSRKNDLFMAFVAAMAAEDVLNRTAAAADMPEVGTFIF